MDQQQQLHNNISYQDGTVCISADKLDVGIKSDTFWRAILNLDYKFLESNNSRQLHISDIQITGNSNN